MLEHVFYGILPGGWFEQISSRKTIQKVFKKFPRKHRWILKKVFFLIMLQTLYLKLYKYAILTSMFSYKFWEFFRTTFPLKTLCDYLWMGSIYSVKMHLQNTSKTLPKYVTNVANMLKIISLTGTPHNLVKMISLTGALHNLVKMIWLIGTPHNLVRRFLEYHRDIYFFVNKG